MSNAQDVTCTGEFESCGVFGPVEPGVVEFDTGEDVAEDEHDEVFREPEADEYGDER